MDELLAITKVATDYKREREAFDKWFDRRPFGSEHNSEENIRRELLRLRLELLLLLCSQAEARIDLP